MAIFSGQKMADPDLGTIAPLFEYHGLNIQKRLDEIYFGCSKMCVRILVLKKIFENGKSLNFCFNKNHNKYLK